VDLRLDTLVTWPRTWPDLVGGGHRSHSLAASGTERFTVGTGGSRPCGQFLNPARSRDGRHPCGDVVGDHHVGTDPHIIADAHVPDDDGAGADVDPIPDAGAGAGVRTSGAAPDPNALEDHAIVTHRHVGSDVDATLVSDVQASAELRPRIEFDAEPASHEPGEQVRQPAEHHATSPVVCSVSESVGGEGLEAWP
jgi:hypothetical protein